MIRAAAVLALLAVAAPAVAESPRRGSFQLRGVTYRPDIDAEFGGTATPWQDVFGSSRGWVFRFDFAKTVWERYGAVEVGLGSGWFQKVGYGWNSSVDPPVKTTERTRFWIVPLTLSAGYRFDWAAQKHNVPLAPYVRVALERYHWFSTDPNRDVTESGATNGFSVTGGLALLLDFLDPTLARETDRDTGINDTYLVVDVTKSWVDDFGSGSSWDLSDEDLSIGFGLLLAF